MIKSFVSKLGFLLGAMLILTGLVFQLNASAEDASSIGLLDGKPVKTGSSNINLFGSTTAITDNNIETYFALPTERSDLKVADTLVYTFETPVNINSYKFHILNYDGGPVSIYFMDKNGAGLLGSIPNKSIPGDGGIYELSNALKDVKQITITQKGTKTYNVAELNFYNEASIQLEATGGNSQTSLTWSPIQEATGYIVRYGIESGEYTETVTATKDDYGNFIIPGLKNGTTYYFIVNAVVEGVESEYSNEASATPQGPIVEPEEPSGNRAILVVTMTTGLEKEFDLSMQEVNSFIDWYEAKQVGSGKASYAIDKHDNNKGPFKSRKDYILFDRVLTFEVGEY
ncbi:fibronectin type III domain-containing protein [Paenibacillus xylanexedens]|uniref:fibronectin type III domain-containing protein n=1 Tax=Paenibacillus xylanexedens TaxID=528191 RepID=UPI000ACDA857|nr:fibronectin type III domain-containing protein [Paenibacillus xylanexedens]